MKIGLLTSSRADYGIYLPLLKKIERDRQFSVEIIAFGTHMMHSHGYTVDQIIHDGFDVKYRIESTIAGDSEEAISTSIGLTTIKFAGFWALHKKDFDLVFCLGDRYEMFAAVIAGIPFNIKFAHLFGGETTLGAIDNVFRHAISHASKIHFCSTNWHAKKLENMLNDTSDIYNVGALGLDNLDTVQLLSIEEFKTKWGISLSKPTILVTFHPETVNNTQNNYYARELARLLKSKLSYHIVITMPNADTSGNVIRSIFNTELKDLDHITLIENFGTQSYFTCMKYCSFLLGNTSSGIIEAASFGKMVINIGNRQEGRFSGENVINCKILAEDIERAISAIEMNVETSYQNPYWNGGAVDKIINVLKEQA